LTTTVVLNESSFENPFPGNFSNCEILIFSQTNRTKSVQIKKHLKVLGLYETRIGDGAFQHLIQLKKTTYIVGVGTKISDNKRYILREECFLGDDNPVEY
jgi:hypothetical protein